MIVEALQEVYQARKQRERDVLPRVKRGGFYPIVRSVTTVLLADISTSLVTEDMFAGVPIIYCNYMGYDEVAHVFHGNLRRFSVPEHQQGMVLMQYGTQTRNPRVAYISPSQSQCRELLKVARDRVRGPTDVERVVR